MEALSTRDYRSDALICAGDVSDDLGILEATLRAFTARFATVFFVPGNHGALRGCAAPSQRTA